MNIVTVLVQKQQKPHLLVRKIRRCIAAPVFVKTWLLFLGMGTMASAQAQPLVGGVPKPGAVYYDADEISVERGTGSITAQGHVFFLFGDTYLAAEKIVYLKDKGLISAEGNVRLIRNKERILASRIVVDEQTREARMDNVKIIADPSVSDAQIGQELLGFTPAELAFEVSRSERTSEIERELRSLREKYVSLRNLKKVRRNRNSATEDEQLTQVGRRYSQLLERLARTRFQPNIVLNTLPPESRQRLERRRQAARLFAERNPAAANQVAGLQKVPGFVRIEASRVYQNPEGNYQIENASITPCNCGDYGLPVWGFSARSAFVEPEQYVTLYGSTVDILTAPIIYSPIIKFPIKTTRQTGLLLPTIFASRSGEVFSQPLFITLGNHADATIVYNSVAKRGNRFDLEGRVQLKPESRLRLYTEYIADKEYPKEYASNKKKIDEKIAALKSSPGGLTKNQEDTLLLQAGSPRDSRWYTQGSWNMPLGSSASVKTDVEFVSDNRYLGDFDKDTGTTQDLFVLQQSARRFMSQEAAAEYYGDDFVLSARAQGERDLFAERASDTPVRLPRVEFNLLPRRYFDLPLALDHTLQWERVHRVGGTGFVDLRGGDAFVQTGKEVEKTSIGLNQRRDPTEPYVEGERTFTQSRVTLPLPANDYLNASVSARGVATQYRFPITDPYPKLTPYQTYASYESNANLPLYSVLNLTQADKTPDLAIRHDLTPGVNFKYIPKVTRDIDFPKPYQLFYEADNIVSTQEVELYLTSDWTITRDTLRLTNTTVARIEPSRDRGVANQKIFLEILEARGLSIEKTPESIFALSAASQSQELFQTWANQELNGYEMAVQESEFGKPFVWPDQRSFRQATLWTAKPASFFVKTTYNFKGEETAREKNALLRPGDKKVPSESWGDVTAQFSWSSAPFLPLAGSVSGIWRRPWNRFREASAGVTASLPFGFSAGFSNSYTITDDKINPDGTTGYNLNRTISSDLGYQPLKWLRFSYQKKLNLLPARAVEGELEYSALQKISFLNVQDCLDITLQRFKDRNVRERYATWSIGLNLSFLGQRRDISNVADSLDRQIKERNTRRDPSTPKD